MTGVKVHRQIPLFSFAFIRPLFVVFFSIALTACASRLPDGTEPLDISVHDLALHQITAWQIRGRLNIRSENESRTPTLFWEQDGDRFDINLSGTLGIGTITLKGDATGLVMEQAGEPPYFAESLTEVSMDWLGYEYPANYLLYWVRGLPAPDIPYKSSRNELGLMNSLNQGEWNIEYDRYENTGAVFLPGRIVLNNLRFRLTFVISDWELAQ